MIDRYFNVTHWIMHLARMCVNEAYCIVTLWEHTHAMLWLCHVCLKRKAEREREREREREGERKREGERGREGERERGRERKRGRKRERAVIHFKPLQVILLADILPSFTMKLIAPYVMNFIPYWSVIAYFNSHSTNPIPHYLLFQDSDPRDCWIFSC